MQQPLVLITGASLGIGKGLLQRFLDEGYTVAATYLSHQIELSTRLMQESSRNKVFHSYKMDYSEISSIDDTVTQIQKDLGHPLILINNGALKQEKPFETITISDWDLMFAANMRGPFYLSQKLIPQMVKAGFGRIINISSIGGQTGGYKQVHYAASKAALISFTRSLAKLYSKDGITSNAISPGLIHTEGAAAEIHSTAGKEKLAHTPIGRFGTVEEVAAVAAFLASKESGYITGQTINVNGGTYFG